MLNQITESVEAAIIDIGPLELIGVSDRITYNNRILIGELWIRWHDESQKVFGEAPSTNYGIIQFDQVDSFSYFAGCCISDAPVSNHNFDRLTVSKKTCVQFFHYGSPFKMRETMDDIWGRKIPALPVTPILDCTIDKFVGIPGKNVEMLSSEIYIPIET